MYDKMTCEPPREDMVMPKDCEMNRRRSIAATMVDTNQALRCCLEMITGLHCNLGDPDRKLNLPEEPRNLADNADQNNSMARGLLAMLEDFKNALLG